MKKILLLVTCVLLTFSLCGYGNNKTVCYQTPRGEWIDVSSSLAKQLLDSFNDLSLVPYQTWNENMVYGTFQYRFKIIDGDNWQYIDVNDTGTISYNDTFYIQDPFEEIFDISREIYDGVYDFPIYEMDHLYGVDYCYCIEEWEQYNITPILVNGQAMLSNLVSLFNNDSISEDCSVTELFAANNKTKINDMIEVKGNNGTYQIKKISLVEEAYLLKKIIES